MGKMRKIIEYIILAFALLLASISAAAQTDRREVRSGNRQFRKENFTRAEIDYRKALVKDSSSFAASYDLANSLYRQNNFEEAGKTLEKVKDSAPMNPNSSEIIIIIWVTWLARKRIGRLPWMLISSLC